MSAFVISSPLAAPVISAVSLARRVQRLKRKVAALLELEQQVPFPLQGSNPEPETLASLMTLDPGIQAHLQETPLDYTDPAGSLELRSEIAGLYHAISPEDVLVMPGAESALYFLFQALLKPGDHVIIQYPCYLPVVEMLANSGCCVSFWPCEPENGWSVCMEDLTRLLRPDTKCLITNSPHNPTGSVLSESVKSGIANLCREHGLIWLLDEVYAGLEPTAQQPVSACELSDQAISIGSVSKALGLPGLRIGWLVCREPTIRQQALDHAGTAYLCMNPITQVLAAFALRRRAFFTKKNRAMMLANRHKLDDFIRTQARFLAWTPPQAGTVAFPQLRLPIPSERFCLELAREQGVLFLPGNLFLDEANHFRVNLARTNLESIFDRWAAYLEGR